MVALNLLAGGFAGYIATYLFNPDAKSLALIQKNPSGQNPSWIEKFALDRTILL